MPDLLRLMISPDGVLADTEITRDGGELVGGDLGTGDGDKFHQALLASRLDTLGIARQHRLFFDADSPDGA